MKKKGFTLIELLVVIAIIAMLLAILMPALNKVKKIAQRVICGTNLKGLGTAQTVYATDYDDEYAVQGRTCTSGGHTWNSFTDGWQATAAGALKDWSAPANMSIGASLYLLVREADVSPKSFVCAASEQAEFSGRNSGNADLVELWDFGHPSMMGNEGPVKCLSYSYHMPYQAGQTSPAMISTASKGKFAADARRSAAFAVMADKNPYFETKLTRSGADPKNYMDKIVKFNFATLPADWSKVDRPGIMVANAYPHGREGQNVTYADGHNSWETRSDVGVKNDNIYMRHSGAAETSGFYNRIGGPAGGPVNSPLTDFAPMTIDDSVLVNDGPLTSQ